MSLVPPVPITRREAIRRTLLFSSSLLAANWLPAGPAATDFGPDGMHLLAFGDFGSKNENQAAVAQAMARFARQLRRPLTAVLALGDNFYGRMVPERFERDFERMYDAAALPCPFHVCFGNHDYEPVSYGHSPEPAKWEVQLDYARQHPQSRWKCPAKWYALELPQAGRPLLKLIVLDSDVQEGALTPQEKVAQMRFLEAELAKGTKAPWTWLMLHHPPFTETTKRRDNPAVLRVVEEALKKHPISVCLAGHDHNLQHLKVDGYGASFLISGAGGADRYEVNESRRGFTRMEFGFNHFHLTPTELRAQFINVDGACLHAFRRFPDGRVEVLT
ncbi:MAG: metallophosphoesterase [Verrucomicrobia bacterium]|nr:metallophosphoesterase [Verrucomicrobiota bacterium]